MLTKNRFDHLKTINETPCISVFIPTEKTGDYQANRIRWKNALNEAKQHLEEKQIETKFLKKAFDLQNEQDMWSHQAEGLAAFITPDSIDLVQLVRKPKTLITIDDHFHVGQLLPELAMNHAVYILALSRNSVKLYRANGCMIKEVHIADNVVLSEDEALRNIENKESLQHHSVGNGNATHHANDSKSEMDNIRLEQFMRRVDDGLREVIDDKETPIILAAVEEYLPRYKKMTRFKNVLDFMITGNPDQRSAHDLHNSLQTYYSQKQQNDIQVFDEAFNEMDAKGLTSSKINHLLEMIENKNVETLLFSRKEYEQLSKDQQARLDEGIVRVYEAGGNVLFTDAQDSKTKAILRYEMHNS